jgi:outer membrane protein OmpA-like peptidoglycan-associated protein
MYYMVGRFEIEQNRVSVKGYGPFRPIASNATPEGRTDNRRVVIVIDSK